MKVLFYNWNFFAGLAGGGVTAYLTEMISQLICDENYEVRFLNSGRKYTADYCPRLERKDNPFGNRICFYEIINSSVLSSGNQSIINIQKYLEDKVI